MNKGLAITGGILTGLSILSLLFGVISIAGHGPDSENILHDTEFDGTTLVADQVFVVSVHSSNADSPTWAMSTFTLSTTQFDSVQWVVSAWLWKFQKTCGRTSLSHLAELFS